MSSIDTTSHGISVSCSRDELLTLLSKVLRDSIVMMLTSDGSIVHWGKDAQRAFGYVSEEIQGHHLATLISAEERGTAWTRHFEAAAKTGRSELELWLKRKDQSAYYAKLTLIRVTLSAGEESGFIAIVHDLTERLKIERSREKSAQLLAQTNNELHRLCYAISHELQEPLVAVTRYSRLLASRYKEKLGSDADEFLDSIMNAGNLIARMIDDLWTYARVTKPGQFEQLEISKLLEVAAEELRSEIDESGAEVRLPAQESDLVVEGNRQQLIYVFKELMLNSIKHRIPGKKLQIDVALVQERNGWTLHFKDNGPGIDKFFAKDAFKIYHRLKGKADLTGTGMGLPICKKIVEQQHQGTIGFESLEGQGANFFVWLPTVHRVTQ